MKLKSYNWALEGLAALILLAGFVVMFMYREDLPNLIIQLIGLGVLFFTIMRIKPILASRNEKDYVIIMVLEFLVALFAGIMMLFFVETVNTSEIVSFARLTGAVFYVRGIVHFYTTAKRYELHDMVSFVVHIVFLSLGFLFLINNSDLLSRFVWVIYFLTLVLSGYFGYRSFNGYKNFRLQKENNLKMQDYLSGEKNKKKEPVIEDPKQVEIDKIEEPKEDRPHVDVN
jgi:hypothetical protein